jgi:hypothetical protein
MISKKSGKEKGKNFKKTYMKEIEKFSIKPIDIEELKLITFKNIIEGSRSVNGVTWNKIKRLKGKKKSRCLKQLSQ